MAINGRQYGSTGPSMPHIETNDTNTTGTKALNLGKVFGIMAIWLVITAGIAFGLGYLFYLWILNDEQSAYNGLMAILIATAIGSIALTFIIQFWALRKGRGMLVLSSLYVLFMGVLCSTLVLFFDWRILGLALGITAMIFTVLAVIGLIARNVRPIAMIGMMLIIGAGLTALITWLVVLFAGVSQQMAMWFWIIDFAMFGGMLLMIIVDLNQIGKICERGRVTNQITLYCALTLYSDFIYIFIKIVYYLAIAFSNNR